MWPFKKKPVITYYNIKITLVDNQGVFTTFSRQLPSNNYKHHFDELRARVKDSMNNVVYGQAKMCIIQIPAEHMQLGDTLIFNPLLHASVTVSMFESYSY